MKKFAFILVLISAGCATSNYEWMKPDHTASNYVKDRTACERVVSLRATESCSDFDAGRTMSRGVFPFYFNGCAQQKFDRCMERKGYFVAVEPGVVQ